MNPMPQIILAVLFLTSCISTTSDPSCISSGTRWTGGNSGSTAMNPGMDCIGCHGNGHGPRYAVAGTVYSDGADADTCDGVGSVSVELKSVDTGETVTATSNSAGNFYLNTNQMFAGKYTARVIANGKVRAMNTPQASGACNSCHTATGSGGAPGRVIMP